MSDRLQFECHPDADQIGAFVEHALPAHEREQMLDHLAVCSECRAVVALSLPSVEEPAKPSPAPSRKPWWSEWIVAWPAAAALATIMLLVLYIHHSPIVPSAPAPTQVARAIPPAPPPSQRQSPVSAAAPPLRGALAEPGDSSLSASVSGAGIAPKQNHGVAVSSQSIAGLAMEGRNVGSKAEMAQASPAPLPASTAQTTVTTTGAAGGAGSGVGGEMAKTPSVVAEARLQKLPPIEPAAVAAVQPSRPAAAPAPRAQTTEMVVVTSAPPIPTVSSDSASMTIAENEVQGTLLKHALPSRLPVLSMAEQADRIVAIDTRNAVFLSKDGGKHWKAIQAQWQGRALKADLVVFPGSSLAGFRRDKTASMGALTAGNAESAGNASGAVVAQGGALKELAAPSLTGTVTDPTGAVIPEASVSVADTATNTVRTVKTDGAGRYIVDGLAPGNYRVEAQARGFMKQTLASVAVAASRQTVRDLSLGVGAVSESVMVETNSASISESKKTKEKSLAASQEPPVFEIITDNGARWTSTDGVTWKRM